MKRWVVAFVAALFALGGIPALMMMAQPPPCGSAPLVSTGAAGGSTAGEASVWQALHSSGFDPVHAAGVMGNMKAESGFDAQIVQGGGHSTRPAAAGSGGYGLVQWTPGRKLSDYIGTATPTVANEVATLKAQLDGRGPHAEKAAGDAFWATRDVASAARVFHLRYERSASKDSSQRVSNALGIYERLQGSAAPEPVGGAEAALSNQPTAPGLCEGMAADVATWNACVCNPVHRQIDGMRSIVAAGADVIGTQELAFIAGRRTIAGTLQGFTGTGMGGSTPIFVRDSKYLVVHEEAVLILRRHYPIDGGLQGGRWMTVAQLQDRQTGQIVTYVNTHMLPHVQSHGKFRKDTPKRIRAYRKQLHVVIDTALQYASAGPVIVMGDFNWAGDPDQAFAKAGMVSASKVLTSSVGTLRGRDIDQVMSLGATPAALESLPRSGSDHAPKLVRFMGQATGADGGGGPVPASFNQQNNPRTVEQAVAWMQRNMPSGAPGEPVTGACERYMNLAYGRGGGYPTALAHWGAPGPRTVGLATPPRGALVFIRSGNPAGHVILSLGNGQAISTDYWQGRYSPGRLGQGSVADIARAMGGPVLGYRAPNFQIGSEAA